LSICQATASFTRSDPELPTGDWAASSVLQRADVRDPSFCGDASQLERRLRAQAEVWLRVDLAIRRQASCLEIRDGVVPENGIAPLMQSVDLIVFPYRQIDASGVFFTAPHYRKPVIASRVGAFVSIVSEYGNGILVEPDAPLALADAFSRIVRHPELLPRLTAAADTIDLNRFSWSARPWRCIGTFYR
jgi:glycosyltransferase involved in cell wall biosynthesis